MKDEPFKDKQFFPQLDDCMGDVDSRACSRLAAVLRIADRI